MSRLTLYDFTPKDDLKLALTAKHAVMEEGQWILQDVAMTQFFPEKTVAKHFNSLPLGFNLNLKMLQMAQKGTDQESIVGILKNIFYRESTGLSTRQFSFMFWKRIMQPLTTIVMICLGIPFIFGSLRSASMGSRVLTGVLVGFCFYMMNQFFGPITMVYQFPPLISAALPTILFSGLYGVLLWRMR